MNRSSYSDRIVGHWVATVLEVLRIRDFRILWGAGLVSALGSWLLVIAVPAHVFQATGSLRATGLTLAAEYLPSLLLGPLAGVLTDRLDRRRLMVGADVFCAAAVALMLLGMPDGRYWLIYVALIAENCGIVVHAPVWQARTPEIVGTGPLLSSANALNAASTGTVRLLGGPAGGVLLTVIGIKWLICADAASYLAAATAVALTSRPDRMQVDGTAPTILSMARDLSDGARILLRQPVARALLPVTIIFLTANASLSAVLIPFGVERLGGSGHTGLLFSCLGIGFLLGAPVVRLLLDRARTRPVLTVSLAVTGLASFVLFSSSSLAIALPAAVAVGMFGSMTLVSSQTTVQRVIPNAALGRVISAFLVGEAAATLIGALSGPFLAQARQITGLAIIASAVTVGAAALAWLIIPRAAELN